MLAHLEWIGTTISTVGVAWAIAWWLVKWRQPLSPPEYMVKNRKPGETIILRQPK